MVVNSSSDSVITAGNYLATFSTTTVTGGVINNIRRLTNGVPGATETMNSNTNTAINFQFLSFTDTNGLAASNLGADRIANGDDIDAFRIADVNNVVDFVATPTVNGVPIDVGGYPTINSPLPTTLQTDGNIIYFTE